MAIQRIKVPNRRLDKISINTANILQGVEKELQDKGQPLSTSNKIKLSSVDSSFKDVGFGLYSQSYKNQDYGKIWVKKDFINEKTGEKESWLVVYEDEDGNIERQASLKKVASIFQPYTEENEEINNSSKNNLQCRIGYCVTKNLKYSGIPKDSEGDIKLQHGICPECGKPIVDKFSSLSLNSLSSIISELVKEASFEDVGFGLYSQSYKNQDYGNIERQASLKKVASIFQPYTEENNDSK